jgi:tripartite-type tricarboxylate transporter receptor subunit TctC
LRASFVLPERAGDLLGAAAEERHDKMEEGSLALGRERYQEEAFMTVIRTAAIFLIALGTAVASPCRAQTYPDHPIHLVVAFLPGGVGDIVARAIADKLATALGQPVTVENRPGETGAIGTRSVARAAPDGYTLLVGQTTEIVVNRVLVGDLGYDPDKDLRPVALIAESPLALSTLSSTLYTTLDDLLKASRANSRGLLFGSGGPGTPGHLAGELLRYRSKTRLTHVPFEGGGPALDGLLSGRVDFYFPVLVTAMPQIIAGQLKVLAVTSQRRAAPLPNVPTLAEAGVQDIDVSHWVGIFAPGATPADVIAKLNKAINEVLAQGEVGQLLISQGADVRPMSRDQFGEFVKMETEKYTLLIREEMCSRFWYGGCRGFVVD